MLHEAASMGDLELCELLLEWEGSDVGSRCLVGRDTAIHFAAIGGNWKVIDMLALYGARINDTDKFALTPLHMATSMEVVKHLIRHGADERIHDSFGRTPGMCAEDRGDTEIAELLGEVSLRRMQKVHRQEQAKVVLAKQADKARAQRLALQAVKQAEKDKAQRLLALKEEYAAWRIPDGRAKARSTAKAKASTSIDGPKEHKALLAKYNRMARDAGRDSTLKSLGNSGTGSRG
jgi:ankyrin repeat protein